MHEYVFIQKYAALRLLQKYSKITGHWLRLYNNERVIFYNNTNNINQQHSAGEQHTPAERGIVLRQL